MSAYRNFNEKANDQERQSRDEYRQSTYILLIGVVLMALIELGAMMFLPR